MVSVHAYLSLRRWPAGTLLLALVLLLGVLSACGGSTSGSSGSTTASPQSSSQSSSSQQSQLSQVHVTLTEMHIDSDVTTFTHGVRYHFLIHNAGQVVHEFTISKVIKNGSEKDRDAASLQDMDQTEPGQTQTLDFTFPSAGPAGTLEFECSYPGHYEMGMHTPIVVQ